MGVYKKQILSVPKNQTCHTLKCMVLDIHKRNKGMPENKLENNEQYSKEKKEPAPYNKRTIEEMEIVKENKKIIGVLKTINDPEINIDIWSLGLIYDISVNNDKAKITMTFTSPMCPYGPMLITEIEGKLREINIKPKIELVFNPFWEPTEEVRNMFGV